MANRERGASMQDGMHSPTERRFSLSKSPTQNGMLLYSICLPLRVAPELQRRGVFAPDVEWSALRNTSIPRYTASKHSFPIPISEPPIVYINWRVSYISDSRSHHARLQEVRLPLRTYRDELNHPSPVPRCSPGTQAARWSGPFSCFDWRGLDHRACVRVWLPGQSKRMGESRPRCARGL